MLPQNNNANIMQTVPMPLDLPKEYFGNKTISQVGVNDYLLRRGEMELKALQSQQYRNILLVNMDYYGQRLGKVKNYQYPLESQKLSNDIAMLEKNRGSQLSYEEISSEFNQAVINFNNIDRDIACVKKSMEILMEMNEPYMEQAPTPMTVQQPSDKVPATS